MRGAAVGLVAVALFASACGATMKKDTTVCEEYRSLRCMTPPECSFDEKRGCRVCQCSPPGQSNPVPPDRRDQTPTTQQPGTTPGPLVPLR